MGGQIADMCQVVHERTEDDFIDTEDAGNGIAVGTAFQVVKPDGKLAKGHYLADSPDGWQLWIVIGRPVMLDEGFLTPFDFTSQAFNMLMIYVRSLEKTGIKMSMTPVFKGQFMGKS